MIPEYPLLYVLMSAGLMLMLLGLVRDRLKWVVTGALLVAVANATPAGTQAANDFGKGLMEGMQEGRSEWQCSAH